MSLDLEAKNCQTIASPDRRYQRARGGPSTIQEVGPESESRCGAKSVLGVGSVSRKLKVSVSRSLAENTGTSGNSDKVFVSRASPIFPRGRLPETFSTETRASVS